MERTLAFAMSEEVKTQDGPMLLGTCIGHRDHGALAWRFTRQHWAEATARFPSNLAIRMVEPIVRLTRPEEAADTAAFFAEHPLPQAAKRVEQVLERQQVNVAMRQRASAELERFFA
jgi:puromycin-sensitive aminopeptidase